jgi:hypothetical protein
MPIVFRGGAGKTLIASSTFFFGPTYSTVTVSNYSSCTFAGTNAIYAYMNGGTTYNSAISLTAGSVNLQVFAVAGGGSGGSGHFGGGGGGGGGGVVQSNITSRYSDTVSITVASAVSGLSLQGNNTLFTFTNQTANSVTAIGGGGGGGNGGSLAASNGGSGGGGGSLFTSAGSGTVGQGYAGAAYSSSYGGGGGGAGGVGGTGGVISYGGPGAQINTTSLSAYTNSVYANFYWAGGGGGSNNVAFNGNGGIGGGAGSGEGGNGGGSAINVATGGSGGNPGVPAANSGGGGGGGTTSNGSSGIVLVAIPYSQIGGNNTDISTTGLVYKYIFNSTTVSGTSVTNLASTLADSTLSNTSCYSTTVTRIAGRGSLYASNTASMTVSTLNSLFTTGGVTFCFWEYCTSLSSGGNVIQINSSAFSGQQGIQFGFSGSGTQFTSWGCRLQGQFPNNTFTNPITVLNVWTHFTITFNSTQIQIFANGVLQNTTNSFTLAQFTPNSFTFGGSYQSYYDDVRVYNRILTQNEILQLCAYVGN